MVYAIDTDGVLANFSEAFRSLIYAQTGVLLPPISDTYPDEWDYHKRVGLTGRQRNALWKHCKETEFWLTLAPLPECAEALEDFRRLRAAGAHIYFVTARQGQFAKHLTEQWLAQHGYEYPSVIMSHKKGHVCAGIEADVFVDDKPENCVDAATMCPGTQVYLLDKPYNRASSCEYRFNNITRVTSILDKRIMKQC